MINFTFIRGVINIVVLYPQQALCDCCRKSRVGISDILLQFMVKGNSSRKAQLQQDFSLKEHLY